MLLERLTGFEITRREQFGINSPAKAAQAFAILARAKLLGLPGNLPAVTGAQRSVVLGKIIPGRCNCV